MNLVIDSLVFVHFLAVAMGVGGGIAMSTARGRPAVGGAWARDIYATAAGRNR